jgi:amino acid adenylation domain-containing protein
VRYLLHHLLEDAARRRPAAAAVRSSEGTLTYAQLDGYALWTAIQLQRAGVRPGDRVGVYASKSGLTVAAVYGVLKAGAVYVPLDPASPWQRLHRIAKSIALAAVISDTDLDDRGRQLAPRLLRLADLGRVPGPEDTVDPPEILDTSLAYILHTSGTTGTPKGVMMTHRNAMAFVGWAAETFALRESDRVSSHAQFHFDLSVFDLYACAYAAATLVIVPDRLGPFPVRLGEFIRSSEITVWYSVPSALVRLAEPALLARGDLCRLRLVLFAGEVFPVPVLRQLMLALPDARFANLYGPTETNVCTWHELTTPPDPDTRVIPIGRAIANTRIWLEREDGTPGERGDVGELLVAGATVMQGYWSPAEPGKGLEVRQDAGGCPQLAYRTGDLVRWEDDGSFTYLGRRDQQIKRNGYRIEPGEIEAALNTIPGVIESAVVQRAPDAGARALLTAFIACGDREPPQTGAVIRSCHDALPAYMIPDDVRAVAMLPRTVTGKVDKMRLASLESGDVR